MKKVNESQFSIYRLWAMIIKEFLQLKRDKPTLLMMIGVPILQLTLFGFAINTDPKNLPTAVISADYSEYTRSFLKAMQTSGYFKFIPNVDTEKQAQEL